MKSILRAVTVGVSLLSVTLFTGCSSAEDTPAAAANAFYSSYAKQPFTGLPTGEAWSRVAPHMSASLTALVIAAQAEQSRCQTAHPGDKPPWIEGDMFTSNFEGFTRFTPTDSGTTSDLRRTVPIDLGMVLDLSPDR